MKTLWHSVKGLCRKPNIIRKIGIFVLSVGMFYAVAHILASRIAENMILAICARWFWIPLSVLFLIIRYGEPLKRRNFKRFFHEMKFRGFDEKLPEYISTVAFNAYLVKVSFKSRIHRNEWEKIIPDLEMFFEREIYRIKNTEDIRIMEIFVIKENLPSFIPWSDKYMQKGREFAIGESYNGCVIWNAANLAHGIVAGATGGGKTALARCIIHQAILKKFNVQVFDFKGGGDYSGIEREYQKYKDLEAGYGPIIISGPEEARKVLVSLTVEVRYRLEQFKKAGVANIDEFNTLGRERFLPWLLVIDEAAQILDVKPKEKAEKELYSEIECALRTLSQTSRAAGVHILMCMIRPSHDVVDGQIKNNLLWRACGYFAGPAASRIVLDNDKATELPPEVKGRFIIGEDETQAYYFPVPKVDG